MTASLSGVFSVQEFTDAGLSGVGFQLYTYIAGTTTQKTAFTDAAALVPHTYTSDGMGGQYIALNARGELPAPLYLVTGSYDITLKRADGSSVWTRQADPGNDGVPVALSNLITALAATGGSATIGYLGTTVEKALTGRLRDVRTFTGIVADGTTDDFVALQAAVISARSGGYGIYWPKGVKTFVQFSVTNPHLFIDGPIAFASADARTSGILVHCNYDMGNVHAPLFCWGITAVGSAVNKVSATLRNLGWFLKAGSSKFERCNHVYGATSLIVEDNWIDFSAVTWPAADGGHPSGYQAGGWFSSNVQAGFASGQTRDTNIRFSRNTGIASAEYQNSECIGFTNTDGLVYEGNNFKGWADDMAAHVCTDVRIEENYYAAVSGRIYVENCQHVKIHKNTVEPVLRPIAGGYLGSTRSYIHANMQAQYVAVTTDAPNVDVTISENTIRLPLNSYCTGAVVAWGVQEGLTIRDNKVLNNGAITPDTVIAVQTLFRAGWTGPAGNLDFAAGGSIRLRSAVITGNEIVGPLWSANDGNIGVTVAGGGAATDIIGPVYVDKNVANGYFLQNEGITFEQNGSGVAATDPFLNVSILSVLNSRSIGVWDGLLPSSANINFTNFPNTGPTFYTAVDTAGLKFIAQRAGRVIGCLLQTTATLLAANAVILRIQKNGVQIGSDLDSVLMTPNTNPARYSYNYAGVAGMTFAKGDLVEALFTIRTAQGATIVVGRAKLLYQYV